MVKKTWDLAVSHNWISSQSLSLLGSSVKEGLHNLHQAHDQSITRVAMLLWSIWKSRNAMIFDNEAPKPMGSLIRAKRNWAEWHLRMSVLNSNSTPPPHSSHNPGATRLIGWRSPPGGYLKLNFDGTHSSSGAAAGFVLRDWRGRLIWQGRDSWRMPQS